MTEYKDDNDKLFPWEDEEGRKRKPNRGDSIPPKTNIQSRVHSKPKTEGQDHLDMYIGIKEKERTEKYGEILKKRLESISEGWRDVKKCLMKKEREMPKVPIGGVEESEAAEGSPKLRRGKNSPKHMKTIDWNY